MKSPTRVAGILGIALVPLLAAGCGSDAGTPPAESRPTVAPAGTSTATKPVRVQTTPSRVPVATSAPATGLRDGQHVAHIVAVDPSARRITVDVVELFTGQEAARAAAEDNAAEVPPPNDYYIRNANPALRTLSVVPGASITVNVHGAAESGSATKDISKTLAELAAVSGLDDGVFRLTLDGGRVTRIAEIYLP
jgi:hypothetical protein